MCSPYAATVLNERLKHYSEVLRYAQTPNTQTQQTESLDNSTCIKIVNNNIVCFF